MKINDVVFSGTYANFVDYTEFQRVIQQLPQLQRLAIVNAQVMRIQVHPQVAFKLTDIIITKCFAHQLPYFLSHLGLHMNSLDLSNNFLTSMDLITHSTPMLKHVNLSSNRLDSIPGCIANMSSLTTLNLSHNQLQSVDIGCLLLLTNLTTLDLSYNTELKALPPDLAKLPSLKTLNVAELISLVIPPYTLAKKGLPSIQKYFARRKSQWFAKAD